MSLETTNFSTYSDSVPLAEYGKPKTSLVKSTNVGLKNIA